MAGKITDARIGIMDEDNRIIQYPSKYADGSFWNRLANPSPTTTYFGKNGRYFYVLPVLKARAPQVVVDELNKIVDVVNAPADKPPTKPKVDVSE